MTIQEAKLKIEEAAQSAYDKHCKPLVMAEMKRLKIRKIGYAMGVYFFTLNNGAVMSDTEFEESTEARKRFAEEYIYPFHERFYINDGF